MRAYLDHNATSPLRDEARAAIAAAMDVVGNPSSVHAEGRKAKAVVEHARSQVARLVGADASEVVFCGTATEAAAQVLAMPWNTVVWSGVEHDCIAAHETKAWIPLPLTRDGVRVPSSGQDAPYRAGDLVAVQMANSETGVLQDAAALLKDAQACGAVALIDAVQVAGKVALDIASAPRCAIHLISAHKLGGPKGVAAMIVPRGMDVSALIKGGGQEMGRRSGTENVIGIAGFGAAADAAKRDVDRGIWDEVAKLRNILELSLEAQSNNTIFIGNEVTRLPNTSCIMTPGWKGETQVMQMDLAGFAISAGSACSSGKVKSSRVLRALGYDEDEAACAIRVSLGVDTTEDEVMRFGEAWGRAKQRHKSRAA